MVLEMLGTRTRTASLSGRAGVVPAPAVSSGGGAPSLSNSSSFGRLIEAKQIHAN
jgi:hypothetical protein